MTTETQLVTITTIVDQLAATNEGITKKALKEIVEGVFTSITDSLAKGDTVRINGVGTFGTAATAARTGRNPSTGEALEIPASTRVSFKAASALKKAVKA